MIELAQRIRRGTEPGWLPVSNTALNLYDTCPKQFHLSYGPESVRVDSGPAASLGTALHAYYAAKHGDSEFDLGSILPLARDAEYADMKLVLDKFEPPEGAEFEVINLLEWDVSEGLRAQLKAILDVRYWLDRMAGIRGIDDWKSGRKVDWGEVETQQKTYALSEVRRDPLVSEVRCRTIFLRTGRKIENLYSRADLERFAIVLEAKVLAMSRDEEFRPRVGPQCLLCPFAHRCDAAGTYLAETTVEVKGGKVEVPKAITEPREAEAAARALFHLQSLMERLKKALKAYGPVELPDLGGAYQDWKTMSKRVRNVEAALHICIEEGIPLDEVFNFDHRRGKKYIEDSPRLAEYAELVPDFYSKYEFRRHKKEKS